MKVNRTRLQVAHAANGARGNAVQPNTSQIARTPHLAPRVPLRGEAASPQQAYLIQTKDLGLSPYKGAFALTDRCCLEVGGEIAYPKIRLPQFADRLLPASVSSLFVIQRDHPHFLEPRGGEAFLWGVHLLERAAQPLGRFMQPAIGAIMGVPVAILFKGWSDVKFLRRVKAGDTLIVRATMSPATKGVERGGQWFIRPQITLEAVEVPHDALLLRPEIFEAGTRVFSANAEATAFASSGLPSDGTASVQRQEHPYLRAPNIELFMNLRFDRRNADYAALDMIEGSGSKIVGLRSWVPGSSIFEDHFEVLPGIVIADCGIQTMAFAATSNGEEIPVEQRARFYVTGIGRTDFQNAVFPGEETRTEVTGLKVTPDHLGGFEVRGDFRVLKPNGAPDVFLKVAEFQDVTLRIPPA